MNINNGNSTNGNGKYSSNGNSNNRNDNTHSSIPETVSIQQLEQITSQTPQVAEIQPKPPSTKSGQYSASPTKMASFWTQTT